MTGSTALGDLATSFSENQHCYSRGRRLVLYDAEGDFDRNFDPRQARLPVVRTDLTAYRGRCWRNAVGPARRGRLGRARAAVKKKRHSHSGRPCKPSIRSAWRSSGVALVCGNNQFFPRYTLYCGGYFHSLNSSLSGPQLGRPSTARRAGACFRRGSANTERIFSQAPT
jgi:hypothetical protein